MREGGTHDRLDHLGYLPLETLLVDPLDELGTIGQGDVDRLVLTDDVEEAVALMVEAREVDVP